MKALVVGHVTKDVIRIADQPDRHEPGGGAFYVSLALRALGWDVELITKVALQDEGRVLRRLRDAGVQVCNLSTPDTTIYENIYPDVSLSQRTQRVRAIAAGFEPPDIEGHRADVVCFGPLSRHELTPAVVAAGRGVADKVAMDPQGILRNIVDSKVKLEAHPDAARFLSFVDIVKTDDREADMIVGESDPAVACVELAACGPTDVLVTLADQGSIVRVAGENLKIGAIEPRARVDATGCGDTYLAGYVHARLHDLDPAASGWFAAAASSLKLEGYGPLAASVADVHRRLSEVNRS